MNRHSSGDGSPRDGGKRERILEAAVKVFADKGFYNAKVSEIAREAGVADGTIYLYFKSKDELLISLFEDRMAVVNDNVRTALASAEAPLDKLRAVVRTHLALVERNRDDAEVLTVELRQSAKFMKEYQSPGFGEFLKLLAGAIDDGQRDGSIRPDLDSHIAARALFGALDELALSWLLRRRTPPPRKNGPGRAAAPAATAVMDGAELGRVAEQLANLFIDGLRAVAPRPASATREGGGPSPRRSS